MEQTVYGKQQRQKADISAPCPGDEAGISVPAWQEAVTAMIDAAATPMAAVTPDGVFLAWNRAMAGVSRLGPERLIGCRLQDSFCSTGQQALEASLLAGQAFQVPVADLVWSLAPLEAPTSRCDWLVVDFSPVYVADVLRCYSIAINGADVIFGGRKDIFNFVQSISGVTDIYDEAVDMMNERRKKLLISEKLAGIGQLAAGVAHEINNPVGYVYSNLNALKGYLAEIIEALGGFENIKAMSGANSAVSLYVDELLSKTDLVYIKNDLAGIIDESLDGIDRVKTIVRALKDFSHIEEDAFSECDLHACIDATLRLAENEIKYKAKVVREYAELPLIDCIPSQLNQVLLNLFVNAAQAIEDQGVITIRTGCADDEVWFEVEDTGCGIPPAAINRLFEPFFTTKPIGEGTGLGLPLSYSIIRKHHGDISVYSELGHGSRFRIRLPVRQDGCSAEALDTQGNRTG